MYGYIYKFTMIPTGKIYVGQHESSIFDESYWGSGSSWRIALKKYGKENVKREILEWCDDYDSLNTRESYWVNNLNSMDPEIGYNLVPGGINPRFSGKNHPMYGKHHSEKSNNKNRLSQLKIYENDPSKREEVSKRQKEFYKSKRGVELKEKYSKMYSGQKSNNKGKIYINKDNIEKYIFPEELGYYISIGYSRGRKKSMKDILLKNSRSRKGSKWEKA